MDKKNNKLSKLLKNLGLKDKENFSKDELIQIINSIQYNKEDYLEKQEMMMKNSRIISIGEMSASISHEINNPLMALSLENYKFKIMAEKAESEGKGVNDLIKLYNESFTKKTNHIKKIVDVIEAMTLLSKNPDKSKVSVLSLNELVRKSLLLIKEGCNKKDISIELKKMNDGNVLVNEMLFVQSMYNLLKNAKDAIEELDKEERWINIVIEKKDKEMLVVINNGGERISEDIESRIFDPFYSTKPIGKGTGIGLSTSKRILNELGGDLIYNNKEKYPSFIVKLPLNN